MEASPSQRHDVLEDFSTVSVAVVAVAVRTIPLTRRTVRMVGRCIAARIISALPFFEYFPYSEKVGICKARL